MKKVAMMFRLNIYYKAMIKEMRGRSPVNDTGQGSKLKCC